VEFTDYDTRLGGYAVIVDDQDRILLALWNEGRAPQWTMPGEGVELDGSTDEARWIPLADLSSLHRVALVDTAIALWSASRRQPA